MKSQSNKQDVTKYKKQIASSGKVSYSDPKVLKQSKKRKLVLVPFFIPRSNETTQLSVKIIKYIPGPYGFEEDSTISLDNEATYNLYAELKKQLLVKDTEDESNYLMIEVGKNGVSTDLSELNQTDDISRAIAGILENKEIVEYLTDRELSNEVLTAFRSAIKLKDMQNAVTELRLNLENGIKDESVYQNWCESHSWAFGNAYVISDDVRSISSSDKLDLLLPSAITGFRDIVELKRPDMNVIMYDKAHRNWYFSSEVSKAIGQTHRYLDVFSEEARKGLRDNPEIIAYHPKGIIVIGRSFDWDHSMYEALHGLNSRLHGITVMTYDQLLRQGERLIEVLIDQGKEDKNQDEENEDFDFFDEFENDEWPSNTYEATDDELPF